jgi:hypothetical protein
MKHPSARGKGLEEDETTPLEPSAKLNVHLYSNLLKLIQPTANQICHGNK